MTFLFQVRYSRLPFRLLCKKYVLFVFITLVPLNFGSRWGCDVTYTPMIVASDFNANELARHEFTTSACMVAA